MFTQHTYFGSATLGCRIEGFLIVVLCYVSIYAGGLIAYDRYRAICTPFNKLKWSTAKKLYIAMWIYCVVSVVSIGFLDGFHEVSGAIFCQANYYRYIYTYVIIIFILSIKI